MRKDTKKRGDSDVFVAMTFNVAHGRGRGLHQTLTRRRKMESNLAQIAKHILQHQPHIVALQEIDQGSFWNHHVDQLGYLRELTKFAHAHHGIHKDGALFFQQLIVKYGVGILSRLEPMDFTSRAFSLGKMDSKGFTSKSLLFGNRKLLVIALHLDFRLHRWRLAQLRQVIEHVQETLQPGQHLIVMGDFNCTLKREDSPLHTIMRELALHTFEPDAHGHHISFPGPLNRRLDYILIDKKLSFLDYCTGNARISDHEYVVAKISF